MEGLRIAWWRVLLGAAALAGCGDDTTSLTIEVSSPMDAPGEIDTLDFLVVGEASGAMLDRSFDLTTGWPHSITVMPAGDPSEMLTITVTGRHTGTVSGEFVVQQRVMERFVEGEERRVEIVLPRDCVFITCGEFHNCVDGVCVGLMRDGGMPDAGDAAAGDAGPPCSSASDCDDGVDCTVDDCASGLCSNAPDDSACEPGTVCDATAGCTLGCAASDPLICDDMDDCTSGVCDDSAMMCVFTTRDADMDGHGTTVCPALGGVPADDCDDTDPAIFLGAVETCNGRDDNCDGACDDGFSCCAGATGSCTTSCGSTGTRTCSSACAWSVCATPPEICNGIDDDCNTACDDGFECCQGAVTSCTTSCGSMGTQTCDGGCNLGTCVPPVEMCNTIDDDCDGMTDEGCGACMDTPDCDDGNPCNGAETCVRGACTPGTPLVCNDGVACTVDSCSPTTGCVATPDNRFCTDGNFCNGTETCTATGCQPGVPPTCDDANACTENACVGTAPGMCVATTRDADDDGYGDTACAAAGGVPNTDCDDTRATVNPGATETCNARDDDCDGMADETFGCVRGSTTSCSTTCGTMGTRTCDTSCMLGSCVPPAEACNAMDDDCDGMIDETVACTAGSTGTCTTSCGSTGTRTCSASCTWGTCNAPTETCNGLDDDCDGTIDETFTCVPGTVGTCSSSCGTAGTRTCSASCTWGTCTPPAETCNGVDDDCDTTCDEGSTCCAGSSGTCTTACGSSGTRTCSSSCGWGTCNPPAETCNGTDDDCDGMCDDGFACCRGMTGSCTTSCGSTGTRTCSSSCGWGSCVAPVETCNGVDDDCDGMTDEGCGACAGCTGAIGVTSPGGRYNVTLGAHVHTGSCGGAGSEGYLTFTTTSTQDVFVSTLGAGIDTVLYVRSCTCNGAEVSGGCNDDALGHTGSAVHLRDLAAGTYNVIVDTKVAMSATITVDVNIGAPGASGDRCSDPLPLAAGLSTFSGNSCGSGNDYDNQLTADCDTAGTGNAEEEVYYFYVPTTRTVTFDGCTTGSTYDSTFYIRRACNDASLANQVACNDDGCGGSRWQCAGGRRSSLSASLTPGLYYLMVDGWSTPPDDCPCGAFQAGITGL